jgi:hypothetical protein
MTEYPVKRLPDAPTIKELRDRLDEVIAMVGGDASWNGFDDEAIYIYPERGQHISIFPGRPEESSRLLKSQIKV